MKIKTPVDSSLSSRFLTSLAPSFTAGDDNISQLLLREYGAVFVARGGAMPPMSVIFRDEKEVEQFQNGVPAATRSIGGFAITLQIPAMAALISAVGHAHDVGRDINPRGPDSGARSYGDTVALWKSRVEPALDHWTAAGRIEIGDAEQIRSLSAFEQVPVVLKLEEKGVYFAKDLSKSIIYSVAPPGTSQHLAMLAFDVKEFEDPLIRAILSEHGWFQTVTSDLPHFTYLGSTEAELSSLGLVKVENAGRYFWVPEMEYL